MRVVVPEFITTSQSTQLQNGRKLILASKAKASVTTFSSPGCTTSGDQPSVSVPAFTCVWSASLTIQSVLSVATFTAVHVSTICRCPTDRL